MRTHRQENIAEIHEEVNDRPDPGEMRNVAPRDQDNGQYVMSEHLPVIVPSLLRINHVELMEPPPELREVIEFRQWREVCIWV